MIAEQPTAASNKKSKRSRRRKRRYEPPDIPPMDLELTGFAPGGKAIAHAPDGRVVFVEYGIPGETVEVRFNESYPSYLEGTTSAVRDASPHRVTPRCEYFGRCGGCQLQHIEYGEQLRLKTGIVREQLERIGHFEAPPVLEMLGMDDPWAYRNHMRFTARREGYVGFMERGTHRFLRIDGCAIAIDPINEALASVQDATTGTRQIAIRAAEVSGDMLVQPALQWRDEQEPAIESGQPFYTERLSDRDFRVSSAAFFQVNNRQAERLVSLVTERVAAVSPDVAVDAYSGVGTFAVMLAESVPRVIAIEESASACEDAQVNFMGIPNIDLRIGSVEEMLHDLTPNPDVLIIDPPRAGMRREVIDSLLASTTKRLVYVSCDPATLSRDLRLLVDGGFTLNEVQPLDMFPHTQHIECVSTLDRSAVPERRAPESATAERDSTESDGDE
jgi:23S rRNA (uracil1939-C5)-methyltransferase